MQGYIRVSPKGSSVALKWNSPSYQALGDKDGDHKQDHDKKDHDTKDHDEHGSK